jgi:hypothetical protein
MPIYFHVSPTDHPNGLVLQPGNWGIQSRQFVKAGNPAPDQKSTYILAWEAALEATRLLSKPSAPSRLNCIFACADIAEAAVFRDRYRSGAHIYEIEVSHDVPTFIGDFAKISSGADGQSFVDYWVNASISYWRNPPSGMKEIIIGGPARILNRV